MVSMHIDVHARAHKDVIAMSQLRAGTTENDAELIKVSSSSKTTAVAGAIAGILRNKNIVEVQAIGASAVNQAVKSLAIASSYLEDDHLSLACLPSFVEVDINGQTRTAIRFSVWV